MKKIVGILAAAAVLATSVFAADVSAKVNILGDAFHYDGASKKISSLAIAEGGQAWNPSFSMSVSDDVSGAWMKFNDTDAQKGVNNVDYQIWFKPVDSFKVSVGKFETNLNQEHINWSNSATSIDTDGFAFSFSSNGLSIDAAFLPGWSGNNFGWNRAGITNAWLVKEDGKDAVLSEMYFKLAYAADFGTISAYAQLNEGCQKDVHEFGAGFSGNFGDVAMFVNASVGLSDSEFGIFRGELYAETNIDAISLKGFVAGGYAGKTFSASFAKDKDVAKTNGHVVAEKAYVGGLFNIGFPVGEFGGYLKIWDGNFMADDLNITFKPGLTKNFGLCAFDGAVELNIVKDKVNVDVPLVFTVAY